MRNYRWTDVVCGSGRRSGAGTPGGDHRGDARRRYGAKVCHLCHPIDGESVSADELATFVLLRRIYYSCSARCTNDIAIDPSPTADATRLTLPARTSPTANTPGRLVSSKCGGRGNGHFATARSSGE